jgi:hypothetical protein
MFFGNDESINCGNFLESLELFYAAKAFRKSRCSCRTSERCMTL